MSRHIQKLIRDYRNIKENPIPNIKLVCEEDNLFNWYCIFYDLPDEYYKDGEYILNIKLSPEHPMKPPDFIFLTPSGRFEINKKICLSNSSYHHDSWSPMWGLEAIVVGILSIFLEKRTDGIGHLNSSEADKKNYALQSKNYNLNNHSRIMELFNE
jgi:ubiquitin-protein ligase